MNRVINDLYHSFLKNLHENCLTIGEARYSFAEVLEKTSQIRAQLSGAQSQNIGLYLTYDMEMYASILAIWFEGKTYVAIHPDFPSSRNENIIHQAEIQHILSSIECQHLNAVTLINTSLNGYAEHTVPKNFEEEQNAYILFTSGSTGKPKGVPISFSNISAFLESFYHEYGEIKKNDKVLQMFELTFDMSVFSYLLPWLNGATMVGLQRTETKFLQILDLLEADELTVAFMVPSIINLIEPYLDPEIVNTSLRMNIFAGEPLLVKQTDFWSKFVTNAKIYNAYGPTENTIICTSYLLEKNPKQRNGILSIGKPMLNNDIRFLDNNKNEGELLLGGKLLTKSYWKNPKKNKESFIEINNTRYYKSGDWCEKDEFGNIYYINRIDFQAKINGFRVELSEIEYFANQLLDHGLSITVVHKDENNNDFLILFTDNKNCDEKNILEHLQKNLPDYAVPSQIIKVADFPLNASGKIDRTELKKHLS